MNEFLANCLELQKFLGRQWQKIRKIVTLEAKNDGETQQEREPLWDDSPDTYRTFGGDTSGDDVEQIGSNVRRRFSIWKGSEDVIVDDSNVTDIVSIIDTLSRTLTGLLDAGHGYRKYYMLLLEALVKLLANLREIEGLGPGILRDSGIFGQLKVSLSITYTLVERVLARGKLVIFVSKLNRFSCTAGHGLSQNLKDQVSETHRILEAVGRSLQIHSRGLDHRGHGTPGVSHQPCMYGVTRLTVAASHHRALLLQGEKVAYFICDLDLHVIYSIQTWLNNPKSFFRSAKRLSASLECSGGLGTVYNIYVPGYPNKETDPENRIALISSGVEHAQVRSYLPVEEPSNLRQAANKAGNFLRHGRSGVNRDSNPRRQKCAGELLLHSKPRTQLYRGDIVMSNLVLKLDTLGGAQEVRKLRIEGKKRKSSVYYKCYVELTGEVLGIYRQKKSSRSEGRQDEGVFHILGVANHPYVRDIIISSFVAMGICSFL